MELKAFLDRYQQRSRALQAHLPAESPLARHLTELEPSLELTRAALAKTELPPDHALQVAVIGPTQAGKSSIVNLILDTEAAGVSPLAGYTVHPQGFVHRVEPAGWLDAYFEGYQRLPREQLPADRYTHFAVEPVSGHPELPPLTLWDTPDFDSLRARHYLHGVLRTAALADLLLVVVSKDKYADRAVWDMLALLEPLGQPVLVCLNKVTPKGRDTLLRSWNEKWRGHRGDLPPPVIPLPYWQDEEERRQAGAQVRAALLERLPLAQRQRRRHDRRILDLARRHWPTWRQPLEAEIAADKAWRRQVEAALAQAIEIYRHDFLDHPIAYETFQRTLAELLILLEIPGIGKPMLWMRRTLTWPLRKLLGTGKRGQAIPEELRVLTHSVEHALRRLRQALAESPPSALARPWWHSLSRHYQDIMADALDAFQQDAGRYYREFQPQVEEAARELYEKLKEMPVTLNALRATRLSADAAGLALLLQTGGIGPHDFFLAPAVLSLTSWLSETALGKYMERVAARLRQRQLEAVQNMLAAQLGQRLLQLPEAIDPAYRFGFDAETLTAVDQQLQERRHGLRLF